LGEGMTLKSVCNKDGLGTRTRGSIFTERVGGERCTGRGNERKEAVEGETRGGMQISRKEQDLSS